MHPAVTIFISLLAGALVDWLIGNLLPVRPSTRHIIAALIVVVIIIVLLVFVPTDKSFEYSVRIQSKASGEHIVAAKVILDIPGSAPLEEFSGSDGYARFLISSSLSGKPGRMIVEANGYQEYFQAIDLLPTTLPKLIRLDPELSPSPSPSNTATPLISATQPPDQEETLIQTETDNDAPTSTLQLSNTPTTTKISTSIDVCIGGGKVLFEETFDDETNPWAIGELIDHPYTDEERIISDGKYRMSVYFEEDALTTSTIPFINPKDFYLSFDVAVVDYSGEGTIYIATSFRADFNKGEYYSAWFGDNGRFLLRLNKDGVFSTIVDLEDNRLPNVSDGEMHHFALVVDGWRITLCANGEELTTVVDYGINTAGRISVGLHCVEDMTVITEFDNMLIRTIN